MTPQEYINRVALGCQETQVKYGIFASVSLAQAILEPGWGRYTPKDKFTGQESFNLFGIKGVGTKGSVRCDTWEYLDDKWVQVVDKFRAYNNWDESINDHGQLIYTKSWYKPVLAATSAFEQCRQLKLCGYATGPTYDQSLISLIQDYKLDQYDFTKEEVTVLKELMNDVADLKEAYTELHSRIGKIEHTGTGEPIPAWAMPAMEKAIAAGLIDTPEFSRVDLPRLLTILDRLKLIHDARQTPTEG